MRKLSQLSLVCLLLASPVVWAEEGADPITARIPKSSKVIVRLPSLDRLDALGKEVVPLLKMFGDHETAALLEKTPASAVLMTKLGLDMALVNRASPVYLCDAGTKPAFFVAAAEGAAFEGTKLLQERAAATYVDGVIQVAPVGVELGEPRGTPTDMLGGDVALHLFLAKVVQENKQTIEAQLAKAVQMAAGIPAIPAGLKNLLPALVDASRGGIYGVEGIDYALTWKGDIIESEGRVTTREGSGLRKLLARAGAPGDNSFAGYLPRESMVVVDWNANPDWPGKDAADFLSKTLGEGAGDAVMKMMGPSELFWSVTSGRGAMASSLTGMMSSATTILELKEGVEPKSVFEGFSVEESNKAFEKLGVEISMTFEKAVEKHGEIEIHRLTTQMGGQLAQFGAMNAPVHLAAIPGYIVSVQSLTAVDELKSLIDRLQKGEVGKHPHLEAMGRLGRKHNFGMSFNFGQVKQMAFLFMMFAPQAAQALAQLPDELWMSTAVTCNEGDIHWRGDWPLKKIAEFAAAVQGEGEAPAGEKEKEPAPADEDFD